MGCLYPLEDFFFHKFHQEFIRKIGKTTETTFLLELGAGWGIAKEQHLLKKNCMYHHSYLSYNTEALGHWWKPTRAVEEEQGKSFLEDT